MVVMMVQYMVVMMVIVINNNVTRVFIHQKYSQQVTNSPCQLEISILTCQPTHCISAQVSKLSQTLDLNCLKVRV